LDEPALSEVPNYIPVLLNVKIVGDGDISLDYVAAKLKCALDVAAHMPKNSIDYWQVAAKQNPKTNRQSLLPLRERTAHISRNALIATITTRRIPRAVRSGKVDIMVKNGSFRESPEKNFERRRGKPILPHSIYSKTNSYAFTYLFSKCKS